MTDKFVNMRSKQARWLILFSFVFALIIDSMTLLNSTLQFIPPISLIAVLYWSSHYLDKTYFVSAFILGILADALYQTTLGAHALLFCFILFMMIRNRLKFRSYPIWQQAFIIGIYLMVYQILSYILFHPVLTDGVFVPYWSMPAAAILIWPFASITLNKITQSLS